MVCNVTCPDTLASSHLNHAVSCHGSWCCRVGCRVEQEHKVRGDQSHVPFHSGRSRYTRCLGSDAAAFHKDLGARIKTVTQERQAFDFLMQRVSVAIQRGNAACIHGTLPSNSNLDVIYNLV